MVTVRKALFPAGLLATAGFACGVQAQGVPAVPAAPPVPGGVPAAAAAAEPAPGFFGKMCLRLDACKRKIADTPLGQLLQNAKKPLSALTGGIVPGGPPKPTDKEAAAPGVAGAAAAGKKDAAEAKKRAEDVKFLGTLDCRYYPDAAKALADALRTDPSECVRYEAALALSRSCCCSAVTVKALTSSVSGTDEDGNPAERSARVRCTAAVALDRCLACYTPPPEEPEEPKKEPKKGEGADKKQEDDTKGEEGEKGKTDADKDKSADPAKVLSTPPSAAQVKRARATLEAFQQLVNVSQEQIMPQVQPTPKSLFHLVQASATEPAPNTGVVMPAMMTQPAARQPAPTPVAAASARTAPAQMHPATPAPTFARTEPKAPPVVQTSAVAPPTMPSADAETVKGLSTKALQGGDMAGQHAAVRELVRYDWKKYPLVASTLLLGAKTAQFKDAVRVDCVRHLAAYKMTHREVLDGLSALAADPDQWVREEAAKALEALVSAR
jgi:hypothetical protein